ncbi:Rz-like lysis system protein LysB [Halopseudomonas phragmitis]|uniref:Peptidase n=1 Tax=Halopseudomonas phragmitis TaxID=1931241 RepID=A0A1V0B6B7_9GAMM|nr:Rz-like lysis system protein LysB [Halopseudomonas phragmitis]AQZ95465.1 peptidase [Halopseudomonas phragmitis]
MTTLRQTLYSLALLTALALLLWGQHQRSQAEQGRTALATAQLQAERQRTTRQATTINELETALQHERQAQTDLRVTHNQLRQRLSTSLHQIEDLKRENEELRQWADQPLPAAARRLRQRPAITGAADYQAWLSSRDALHPATSQPPD